MPRRSTATLSPIVPQMLSSPLEEPDAGELIHVAGLGGPQPQPQQPGLANTARQVQLTAYKNLQIKKRDWKKTAVEVLYPIYFIGILMFMQTLSSPISLPPAVQAKRTPLLDTSLSRLRILYSPNTTSAVSVMDRVRNRAGLRENADWKGFDTEAELVAFNSLLHPPGNGLDSLLGPGPPPPSRGPDDISPVPEAAELVIGVVFNSLTAGDAEYTIRTQGGSSSVAMWTRVTPAEENATETALVSSGFVTLQHAINEAIGEEIGGTSPSPHPSESSTTQLQVAKCARESYDARYGTGQSGFGFLVKLYLPLAFLTSAQILAVAIVEEKEKKLREGMRMMGLNDGAYWLSWLCSYMLLALVTVAVSTWLLDFGGAILCHCGCTLRNLSYIATLRMTWVAVLSGLFPHTSAGWLFVMLIAYNVALVPPCTYLPTTCPETVYCIQLP